MAESIDLHSVDIDRAANAAHMTEAKAARERSSAEKQGMRTFIALRDTSPLIVVVAQELYQLQCWLSPSTVDDDLQKYQSEYMPGSCDWIIETIEFKKWLNAPLNQSLQIFGRPGSGKSTLAAFLVQKLYTSTSPVLYFFCDSSDSEKRDTCCILRTLLAQLLRIKPALATHLLPIYRETGRMLADSEQVIKKAFETAMVQQQDNSLYLVIDAVDECNSWDFKHTLYSFIEDTEVKLLITYRVAPTWESGYPYVPLCELEMKPEFASDIIHQYAIQRVQKMAHIAETDLARQGVKQISESSNGLWLYARLVLDEVERAPSAELVKKHLVSPPHGLSDLYTQVLRSCESRMTNDHREFAKYLYIWLDVGDYMPS